MVAPVAAIGLDEVAREDLTGGEVDDGDLALIDDGQDPTTGMGRADLEMVHAAGSAQADGTLLVGDVIAQAEVAPATWPGGQRLGCRAVGLAGRATADGPVGSLLVVGVAEGIELGLELREGPCGGLLPEPALQRLVEELVGCRSQHSPWQKSRPQRIQAAAPVAV